MQPTPSRNESNKWQAKAGAHMGRNDLLFTDEADEECGESLAKKGTQLGEKLVKQATRASRTELRMLVDRQDRRCSLTGVPLTPDVAELDHIAPVSEGGDNSIDNLQVVHKVVNRMKGAMGNEEFVAWCQLVADRSGGRARPPYGLGPCRSGMN